MAEHSVDLFVIGGGSGGVRAARVAAGLGASVAIAEDRHWGGTCVNVGCVPKKLFVLASEFGESFADAAGFGWNVGQTGFDWGRLLSNKNKEIERLNGIYAKLLTDAGVTTLNAHARLYDAHTIEVGEDTWRAEHILIATGGEPVVPGIPGHEHIITSDQAFFIGQLPKRVVVVGGGYIAVEFAGIFAGLGVETHLLYRGDLFMRGFDEDLRTRLHDAMQARGVHLHMPCEIEGIDRNDAGVLSCELTHGDALETDLVMYAIGRRPRVQGLGLGSAGVQTDTQGAIEVDERYRTTAEHIYAVGDVTNRVNLTPVALAEGTLVAQQLYGSAPTPVDYEFIPTAVFSQPALATVGYTEAEARAKYADITIYESAFRPMRQTLTERTERAYMKLVVDSATDRVVGVHMLGPEAAEILQGFAVAVRAGATKALFDTTLGIHPSAAEEFVTMRTPRG